MHEPRELLRRFTSAVYEIQQQYSQGGDIIRNCHAVDQLCCQVDSILHHGLKEGLLSWASNTEVSFWPLAIKVTNKENIEEINRLTLKSERYKCLAWVKLALKENTLGSYIGIITQDEEFLRDFYHPHAFMCDRKKVETLASSLVYGISTLDFDISLTDAMSTSAKDHEFVDSVPDHLPVRSGPPNGYDRLSSSCREQGNSMFMSREQTDREDSGKKKRKKKKKAGVVFIADGDKMETASNSDKRDKNVDVISNDEHRGLQNGCEKSNDKWPKHCVNTQDAGTSEVEDITAVNASSPVMSRDGHCYSVENTVSSFDQAESVEQLLSEQSAGNVNSTIFELRTSADHIKATHDENIERDPVERDSVERDPVERDPVERDPVERDPVQRDPVERDPVERDPLERDPVERDPVERDPVQRDPVERDPVERDPVERDPVERDPVERDPVERDPVERDPVERDPVERDPVERDPVERDPVERDPVERDPVERDPVERDPVGDNYVKMSAENLNFASETYTKSTSVASADSNTKSYCADKPILLDNSLRGSMENGNSATKHAQGLAESNESNRSSKSNDSTASEKSVNTSCERNTSLSEENRVSLATFQCGTPKKIDDPSKLNRYRRDSIVTYDDEDFNFVPGIHKAFSDKLSHSSSVGSFTGSGSFSNQKKTISDATQRASPMDSLQNVQSSLKDSPGVSSDSWKYVNDFFASPSRKSSVQERESVVSDESFSGFDMFDDLLGIEEDHFSPPESFMGVSTAEELEHAIESCKAFAASAPEHSEERSKLVDKLVQLRLKLREIQDASHKENSNARRVLGHVFVKDENPSSNVHCDKCGKGVWMWHSLFTCQGCNFNSHRRCLDMIRRPCARRRLSVSTYNTRICQEGGLSSQQYKCVECRKRIALTKVGDNSEARLCDYSGQFFCEDCHWNDLMIIPARVIHNWDFTSRKVSRQTKQLLSLMLTRPLLNVEELNPALFKFVGELREVKRFREEVLLMKKYFMTCREALESKLLLQLQDRPHFVDSSTIYSLQDLIDVEIGSLLPTLTRTHSLYLTHIKTECQLCQAKGFVCELCKVDEIIFAFDPHCVRCGECKTVFHKLCFKTGTCPKCQRRRKREEKR